MDSGDIDRRLQRIANRIDTLGDRVAKLEAMAPGDSLCCRCGLLLDASGDKTGWPLGSLQWVMSVADEWRRRVDEPGWWPPAFVYRAGDGTLLYNTAHHEAPWNPTEHELSALDYEIVKPRSPR